MSTLILIFAACLTAAGIVSCFIPVVPGPLLSYCGVLCLLSTDAPPSMTTLVAFGVATIVVSILDYVIPMAGAKRFNCSKIGVCGVAIGTIAGLFFFPLGLVLGPFLGAFIVELIVKKSVVDAAIGGIGALLGFLASVSIKMLLCVGMLAYVIFGAL
ncbi:MAG: DUF456 domain-containing protein [Kiritimatiellae bacterium]|nr:DUF456 domain-containing protein [Kiritimatiellia bacterium]